MALIWRRLALVLAAFAAAADAYEIAKWEAGTTMPIGRYQFGMVRIPSTNSSNRGHVMVAGGYNNAVGYLDSVYMSNVDAGTWSGPAAAMPVALRSFGMVHIPSADGTGRGHVMVAGGNNGGSNGLSSLDSVYMYDVDAGTWSGPAAAMPVSTRSFGMVHIPSADGTGRGQVMVAGGAENNNRYLDSVYVYDVDAGTWGGPAAAMPDARGYFEMVHIPSAGGIGRGHVMVAGGISGGITGSVHVYDVDAGTWGGHAAATPNAQTDFGMVHIPSVDGVGGGQVMVAGGSCRGGQCVDSVYFSTPVTTTTTVTITSTLTTTTTTTTATLSTTTATVTITSTLTTTTTTTTATLSTTTATVTITPAPTATTTTATAVATTSATGAIGGGIGGALVVLAVVIIWWMKRKSNGTGNAMTPGHVGRSTVSVANPMWKARGIRTAAASTNGNAGSPTAITYATVIEKTGDVVAVADAGGGGGGERGYALPISNYAEVVRSAHHQPAVVYATVHGNRNAPGSAGNVADDDDARYSGYAPPGASEGQGAAGPRYSGYAAPANSGSNIVYAIPLEDNIDNTAAACGSGGASAYDGQLITAATNAKTGAASAYCDADSAPSMRGRADTFC